MGIKLCIIKLAKLLSVIIMFFLTSMRLAASSSILENFSKDDIGKQNKSNSMLVDLTRTSLSRDEGKTNSTRDREDLIKNGFQEETSENGEIKYRIYSDNENGNGAIITIQSKKGKEIGKWEQINSFGIDGWRISPSGKYIALQSIGATNLWTIISNTGDKVSEISTQENLRWICGKKELILLEYCEAKEKCWISIRNVNLKEILSFKNMSFVCNSPDGNLISLLSLGGNILITDLNGRISMEKNIYETTLINTNNDRKTKEIGVPFSLSNSGDLFFHNFSKIGEKFWIKKLGKDGTREKVFENEEPLWKSNRIEIDEAGHKVHFSKKDRSVKVFDLLEAGKK